MGNCEICTNETCIKYKIYIAILNNNHKCVEKIPHSINQNLMNDEEECLNCNSYEGFYCISNKTSVCLLFTNLNSYYSYSYTKKNITCWERCNNTFNNCIRCNLEHKCIQ